MQAEIKPGENLTDAEWSSYNDSLLSCPFQGATASTMPTIKVRSRETHQPTYEAKIFCGNYGTNWIYGDTEHEAAERAVRMWNRRSELPPLTVAEFESTDSATVSKYEEDFKRAFAKA